MIKIANHKTGGWTQQKMHNIFLNVSQNKNKEVFLLSNQILWLSLLLIIIRWWSLNGDNTDQRGEGISGQERRGRVRERWWLDILN